MGLQCRFAAERSSAGVMASKKDESNLMLRLMMKEREQVQGLGGFPVVHS